LLLLEEIGATISARQRLRTRIRGALGADMFVL